jgi:hypothetical protein
MEIILSDRLFERTHFLFRLLGIANFRKSHPVKAPAAASKPGSGR